MGLTINQDKVTVDIADQLIKLCPFSAITYENNKLDINSACKLCKLCVKKGPEGVIQYNEDNVTSVINKDEWRGITVFANHDGEKLHDVTLELLTKAKELAKITNHPVQALVIGYNTKAFCVTLLTYGADFVYTYDDIRLKDFDIEIYANIFENYINEIKPSSILVGATNLGRSLAPRVAARFKTGLTADCTVLEMKDNTDLVQIRPAFGGNIMAQIVCPNNRPQFCTVRYKIFSIGKKIDNPNGKTVTLPLSEAFFKTNTTIKNVLDKPKESDICDSNVIVAIGRGVKNESDLEAAKILADKLGASLACTRPLVESGAFDAKCQIGLSGKTVKPKLIITLGISGAIQFAAGMKNAECIISVNTDRNAPIFEIAHYGIVGNISEVIPLLINKIEEAQKNV